MDTTFSTLAHIALTMAPRLNNRLNAPLFERCGGVENFFRETEPALSALLREARAEHDAGDRGQWMEMAKREAEWMERHGARLCTIRDAEYPSLLKQCADAPLTLYYKGALGATERPRLAVVGTRKASERVKKKVEAWIGELAGEGHRPEIVSGLAYGIDIAAHAAALHNGLSTIAVLGHGLHTVYPAPHRHYAEKIADNGGALVSEFPTQAAIYPQNFLQRNRIVAGMCEATLVAESPVKGGAMSTARLASSYDREVMAIPGRPEDTGSEGCNWLIKQNIAALVDRPGDIVRALGWQAAPQGPRQTSLDLFGPSDDERRIREILAEGEQNIDQLHLRTRIPVQDLSVILLKLELEGTVTQLPGNCYALC